MALFLQLAARHEDPELPGARYSAGGDGYLSAREGRAWHIGPAGSFGLREITLPLLLLAGGTGLAPFLSMLGKITETGSAQPIHPGQG